MTRRPVVLSGGSYLPLVTRLLQQMRLASPIGGVWEAADVQWWWRQERPTDSCGQLFWLDEKDEPVAAVIVTDFFHSVQCDVLVLPKESRFGPTAWQDAFRRVDVLGIAATFPVRSDDAARLAGLTDAGYRPASEPSVVATWRVASGQPQVPVLAPGYRLVSRAADARQPHWLAARNGPDVEARLRQCSLYEPELDLAVEAPDGRVAGYGLFWADPVTRVGLVEPMRTEEAHLGRGIASHILASGLERLTGCGCSRLKVMNNINLYLRAGFEPLRAARLITYARPASNLRQSR